MLSLSICVVIYNLLVTDLYECTGFRLCLLIIFRSERGLRFFEFPINFEAMKSNLDVLSYIVSRNYLLRHVIGQ